MAKYDWKKLLADYASAYSATGISPADWCVQNDVPYSSAKRYITIKAATDVIEQNSQIRSSQKEDSQIRKEKGANRKQAKKPDNYDDEEDDGAADTDDHGSESSQPDAKLNGRDSAGRFTEGNPGNPNAVSPFVKGHQYATKHGAYAQYLHADELFDAAKESDLRDELIFTRARALSVTKTLNKIMEDLQNAPDVETRIDLYDKMLKAEQGLDRNIARIESLENSLSRLQLDAVNVPRLAADTFRIKAATAKLKAETEKLTAESKDVTTPLTDVVRDIHDMPDDGMLAQ
ncbi:MULTISPECIES: terminase [unclassified Brenneria]|uniref:terminase n=1 Tax=unclassified Brenneria TaxID=2634434 RepID=UPI0015559AE5|nr:terminase [Brenneria sp. hezel4-2-4]MEE3649466.1 terminase [Brenneria sp. HEZEL_4_2_4]NPC99422.1 terminase [Brenneria sp. hezel4-2-4]